MLRLIIEDAAAPAPGSAGFLTHLTQRPINRRRAHGKQPRADFGGEL